MVLLVHDSCFLEEPLGDFLVLRHVPAQDLDGDLLVDDLVLAPVDDPHPPFAELRLDEVAAVDRLRHSAGAQVDGY